MKKIRYLLAVVIFAEMCVNCCVSAYKGLRVEVFKVPAQLPVALQLRELRENVSFMNSEMAMAKLKFIINALDVIRKDERRKLLDGILSFMNENREKICVSEAYKNDYERMYSKVLYYKALPLTPRIKPLSPLHSPVDGWNVQMDLV